MKDNLSVFKAVIKKYGIVMGLVTLLILGLVIKPDFLLKLMDSDKHFIYFSIFIFGIIILVWVVGRSEEKNRSKVKDKDTVRDLLKTSFESFIANNIDFQKQINEILNQIISITDDLNDNIQYVKERLIEIDKQIYEISNKIHGNLPHSLLMLIMRDSVLLIIYDILQRIYSLHDITELENFVNSFKFNFSNDFINDISLKYLNKTDKATKDYIIEQLKLFSTAIYEYLNNYLKELKESKQELTDKHKNIIRTNLINILYKTIFVHFQNGGGLSNADPGN